MRLLFFFIFLSFFSNQLVSQCSIVNNGDFELGNTGFTSPDQSYIPGSCPVIDGTYAVTTNSVCGNSWTLNNDHTTGSGQYMLVNIDNNSFITPAPDLYCTTINTTPGQEYHVSYWGYNITNGPNNPNLDVTINGIPMGNTTIFTYGSWIQCTNTFIALFNTTDICIFSAVPHNGNAGQDIAIDDVCVEPDFDSIQVNMLNTNTNFCEGDTLKIKFNYFGYNGSMCFNVSDGTSSIDTIMADNQTLNIILSSSGTYTVKPKLCSISPTYTFNVTVDPSPNSSFTSADICFGDVNVVNAVTSGGIYSIFSSIVDAVQINPNTGELSNVTAGNSYILQYELQNLNCVSKSYDTVTVFAIDDASFSFPDFCDGGTNIPVVTGLAGGTFSFNPIPNDGATIHSPTGTILGYTAGNTYTVSYLTNGNCPSSSSEVVSVLTNGHANFSYADFCPGASVLPSMIQLGGVFSFATLPNDLASINPSTGQITNETPGATYLIKYKVGACPDSAVRSVHVFVPPTATISGTGDICDLNPDTLKIILTGALPFDFTYTDGLTPTNFTNYVTTRYFLEINQVSTFEMVQIKDLTCTGTFSGQAKFTNSKPLFSIDSAKACPGNLSEFKINSNLSSLATCTWYFENGDSLQGCGVQYHLFEEEGCENVTLKVDASNGCSGTTEMVDIFCTYPVPEVSFAKEPENPSFFNDAPVFYNTSTHVDKSQWSVNSYVVSDSEIVKISFPPDTSLSHEVCLIVISDKGCRDTLCETVKVKEDHVIYVPSSFTPNEDGVNDYFKPIVTQVQKSEWFVFNRWGDIVFKGEKLTDVWDGKKDGDYVPTGVYVWEVIYITDKGLDKLAKGKVTVLY